jgi:hypothetical protein
MNARDSVLAKNTCESFFAVNVSLPSWCWNLTLFAVACNNQHTNHL